MSTREAGGAGTRGKRLLALGALLGIGLAGVGIFEPTGAGLPESAIVREKQMKKWNRSWKIRLIEEANPGWNDLSPTIV